MLCYYIDTKKIICFRKVEVKMANIYEKATVPTMYFIGVTTGSSSIMKVFPKWAKALGLKDAVIKGIDLSLTPPQRNIVKQ